MQTPSSALFTFAAPSLDLVLAFLALALPAIVALVPSVLGVLVLPAPVGLIYRIHHHRRVLLAVGWAAAALLLLRGAAGAVPLGGVLAVEGAAVLLAGFYLALYPGRVFAPATGVTMVPAARADLVGPPVPDDEEVVGLLLDGEPRAYTLTTLIRSHLVLDRHGDEDLAVTYCSLSSTGSAFRARGRRLRTVTAVDNNVILYDEASGDLVHQAACRVVCGPGAGTELESVPVVLTRWGTWRRLYPETRVGHDPAHTWLDRRLRSWMLHLHEGLAARSRPFHPLSYVPDSRLPPMARVLGVTAGGVARAYPLDDLPAPAVLEDRLGGEPLVVLSERRSGAVTGAFSRRLDGRELSFEDLGESEGESEVEVELQEDGEAVGAPRAAWDGDGGGAAASRNGGSRREDHPVRDALARDRQTGSLWSAAGRAVAGPLAGRQLDLLPQHQSAFWFAWAAVHPRTEIAGPGTVQPAEVPGGVAAAAESGFRRRAARGA